MTPLATPPDPRATDPLGVPRGVRIAGIVYDWDAWPAKVAEGAGVPVTLIVMSRRVNALMLGFGLALGDVFVPLAKAMTAYYRPPRPSLRARLLGWLRRR